MSIADIDWAGPRPLAEGQHLVGRARELRELYDVCGTYHVVRLTAWSGVGKTSFVRAGLIPMLRGQVDAADGPLGLPETFVPEMRPWPVVTAEAGAEGGLESDVAVAAGRLYRAAIGASPDDGRSLADVFADMAEGRPVVVVLDQFEEMLRYQRGVAQAMLKLAGETARDLDIVHIVIARSEYLELLQPIEVRAAAAWSLSLPELNAPEVLRAIVEEPARAAGVDIESSASELLIGWWADARAAVSRKRAQRVGGESLPDIGLLDFQALLWSFRRWAAGQDASAQVVTEELVRRFVSVRAEARRADAPGLVAAASLDDAPAWLFEDALVDYVSMQANRLTASPMFGNGRKIRWRNGPRLMLARVAPAMTAVGFKQPQTVYSLIPQALADELTARRARELAERLEHTDTARNGHDPAALYDRKVVGAGIAADWAAEDVTKELIEALRAALHTMSLADVNVLREIDRPNEPIYELVHDGMGVALTSWARRFLRDPAATIGVIGHQPGRVVEMGAIGPTLLDGAEDDALELWGAADLSGDPPRLELTALGWPASAIIGMRFEDVHFKGCDFTGASFMDCSFKNVLFDECSLTGGLMTRCVLDGVKFRVGHGIGNDSGLDLFTVKAPGPGSDVSFEDVPATTGIFLEGLAGGRWAFRHADIRHMVVEAVVETELLFEASRALPISTSEGVKIEKDSPSVVLRVDLVQS